MFLFHAAFGEAAALPFGTSATGNSATSGHVPFSSFASRARTLLLPTVRAGDLETKLPWCGQFLALLLVACAERIYGGDGSNAASLHKSGVPPRVLVRSRIYLISKFCCQVMFVD